MISTEMSIPFFKKRGIFFQKAPPKGHWTGNFEPFWAENSAATSHFGAGRGVFQGDLAPLCMLYSSPAVSRSSTPYCSSSSKRD